MYMETQNADQADLNAVRWLLNDALHGRVADRDFFSPAIDRLVDQINGAAGNSALELVTKLKAFVAAGSYRGGYTESKTQRDGTTGTRHSLVEVKGEKLFGPNPGKAQGVELEIFATFAAYIMFLEKLLLK